jgi:hypothetical protein
MQRILAKDACENDLEFLVGEIDLFWRSSVFAESLWGFEDSEWERGRGGRSVAYGEVLTPMQRRVPRENVSW